jgi:hypothetical protein
LNGTDVTPTGMATTMAIGLPPDRPSGIAEVARKPRRCRKKRFVVVYGEPGIIKDAIFAFESAPDASLKVFERVIPAAYRQHCRVVSGREWRAVEAERKRDAERALRSMTEVIP